MTEITLDVSSSLHTRGFDANERIHSKGFGRVKTLIRSQLEKAKDFNENNLITEDNTDFARYYNTIFVFGERGVGKTSFLLSLRKECSGQEQIGDNNHDNG